MANVVRADTRWWGGWSSLGLISSSSWTAVTGDSALSASSLSVVPEFGTRIVELVCSVLVPASRSRRARRAAEAVRIGGNLSKDDVKEE